MKDIIQESTTDGSLESFIYTMRLGIRSGVFTNAMFRDVKKNFMGGVIGSLKGEMGNLPSEKRTEFMGYVTQLMKPLQNTNSMESFINNLGIVADTKNNIIKRLGIRESMTEGRIKDRLTWLGNVIKKSANGTTNWWAEHKEQIIQMVSDLLVQILIQILSGILRAVSTPKHSGSGKNF